MRALDPNQLWLAVFAAAVNEQCWAKVNLGGEAPRDADFDGYVEEAECIADMAVEARERAVRKACGIEGIDDH